MCASEHMCVCVLHVCVCVHVCVSVCMCGCVCNVCIFVPQRTGRKQLEIDVLFLLKCRPLGYKL